MDSDGEEDDDSQATDQGPVLAPKKETAEQRRLREIREAFLAKRKADLAELCELPSVVRAFEAWLEDEDRGEFGFWENSSADPVREEHEIEPLLSEAFRAKYRQ